MKHYKAIAFAVAVGGSLFLISAPSYARGFGAREIVRSDRLAVHQDHRDLHRDHRELAHDRKELHRDFHHEASIGEITTDLQDLRNEQAEIREDRGDLNVAHRELRRDRHGFN
jgi:hypothetical protein